jgi:hypothetical protein
MNIKKLRKLERMNKSQTNIESFMTIVKWIIIFVIVFIAALLLYNKLTG